MDVLVGERVVNVLAASARLDKPIVPQYAQLMRHCGLRHGQNGSDVADAELALVQHIQYLNARAVAEDFEQLLEHIEAVFAGQMFAKLADSRFVLDTGVIFNDVRHI